MKEAEDRGQLGDVDDGGDLVGCFLAAFANLLGLKDADGREVEGEEIADVLGRGDGTGVDNVHV